MKAMLPVFFLGTLTLWSGTFVGGATFFGAVSAHAVLLAFSLFAGAGWRDPLGLGSCGRWLHPVLLVVVGASWWLGSAHRAGIVGLALLPAFLLIPSAVAGCWRTQRERCLGLASVGLLLAFVALVALFRWQVQGSPRAAMPLGHHNLLATWLVILWPIGLVSLRYRGGGRVLSILTATATVAALAATGSFLGSCALGAQVFLAALWWKRARPWLVVALLAVWVGPPLAQRAGDWLKPPGSESAGQSRLATGHLERASRMVSRTDSSFRARTIYARAGWEGFKHRPLAGWGPGSVPWTLARWLEPAPGVLPPGEVVGDLHSWPLQLAYETGALGLAAVTAIALLFLQRRRRELTLASDPAVLEAALVGLCGGAVMLLGNAPAHILALPAALAVTAGAALACTAPPSAGARKSVVGLVCLYLLPVVILLVPFERAHYLYQKATTEKDPRTALASIRNASEIDPGFPLYRARAAWLAADLRGADGETATEALRAARQARHLAPLWLAAGAMAVECGQPWAEEALETARELDPLSPLAAFHLLQSRPGRPDAVDLGVSAVEGESRLGRALFWESYPELREAVFERLDPSSPGAAAMRSAATAGPTALLVQSMDLRSARSMSVFAFRRSPWPADLAPVEVRPGRPLGAVPGR